MQAPDLLGFHHIHLHSSDVEGTIAWYQEAPTKGRSIDHLGFSTPDLDAAAEALKAKGVTFSLDPMPYRNVRISFIDGLDGVRIEYVQPASE